MATETRVIPDLYFPDEDQELQTSSVEGEGGRGQGGGLEGGETVDLTPEGFIPIHKLALKDLPEPIRTEEHLQYILDISKNIVKVNNNGLSDKRPDDDEFKMKKQRSLSGSGCILPGPRNNVLVTTNRHVLFNEEELRKSTFDVFYDYHFKDPEDKQKLFKRCVRTNGHYFWGKFSKNDIAHAVYVVKDAMVVHVEEHCLGNDIITRHVNIAQGQDSSTSDPKKPPTACLISHPLGQPKHVSFGEMVDYNMQSRTVYHTAPSKPGSSGGRVIVFSESLLAYPIVHVGTNPDSGRKYSRVHLLDTSLVDMAESFQAAPSKQGGTPKQTQTTSEDNAGNASTSLEIAHLSSFAPLFGTFLLLAEETRLAGLNRGALRPCRTFTTEEPSTSHDLQQSVKELSQKLAALSFTLCSSSNPENAFDLVSLLESQGPCYCQSIVKMMERGVKLEDGTVTECFLSPYTAAAKMSSDGDVTWPWSNGSSSDVCDDEGREDCLLKKSLELCHHGFIPFMLLLMITKANTALKEACFVPSDGSSDMINDDSESQWKTVYTRTNQVHSCEQDPEKQPGKTRDSPTQGRGIKLNPSTAEERGDWHRLTEDILTFIYPVLRLLTASFVLSLPEKRQTDVSQQEEESDFGKPYSTYVAVTEHARQHEHQIHPDTARGRGEDSRGNWCRCGRPGTKEAGRADYSLGYINHRQVESCGPPFASKVSGLGKILEGLKDRSVGHTGVLFKRFLQLLRQTASQKSLPPGAFIVGVLDHLDAFPHGRHSLVRFLASEEALLYNFCLLARHISKRLQPWYFAFPVSVFGRPGNWPGNVTPPEVRRTAWRLIQDAIMASGFPPAVLAALKNSADRREKLIDLYVDMKQLKWQGRIQPWLFQAHRTVSGQDKINHLHTGFPFENSTHYFVWYAAYLVCPKVLTS